MPTQIQIVNRALTEIAQGPPLPNGETVATNFGGSDTGIYAATLYPGAVLTLLRNQDFEFCRRSAALVPTGKTPPLQWSYEYVLPVDCQRLRQVVPQTWLPLDPQPIRWDVGDRTVQGIISFSIVVNGGAGYALSDTGFVLGTAGTQAQYVVTSVGGGGSVTGYTLTAPGDGYPIGLATTLAGGGQPGAGAGFVIDVTATAFSSQEVIWTNIFNATAIYSSSFVSEAQFDSVFTEQLVRYLGSMLSMPVAGRPDFSREMLNTAGKMGLSNIDRDS